ncbi:MAG: class I SAM-dependent methyltransferase, partial [Lentisphaeria bacterium]
MSYRDIAKHYDKIFPFAEERITFLKKFLPKGKTILDLGCGTGKYTAKLNQDGYDVIGFDVDKEMLKVAKKNYFDSTFVQEDIL